MRAPTPLARRAAVLVAVAAAAVTAACKEVTVPNYNSPNVEQLTGAPNASTMNTTALGLLVGARATVGTYATGLGILGVGSSRVDLQACKLEYSIVSPK